MNDLNLRALTLSNYWISKCPQLVPLHPISFRIVYHSYMCKETFNFFVFRSLKMLNSVASHLLYHFFPDFALFSWNRVWRLPIYQQQRSHKHWIGCTVIFFRYSVSNQYMRTYFRNLSIYTCGGVRDWNFESWGLELGFLVEACGGLGVWKREQAGCRISWAAVK